MQGHTLSDLLHPALIRQRREPVTTMLNYFSGQEIHIEDRVIYAGQSGHIAFVIDNSEYSEEFPEEHWSDYKTGFMIKFENGGLLFLNEADEDLDLVTQA